MPRRGNGGLGIGLGCTPGLPDQNVMQLPLFAETAPTTIPLAPFAPMPRRRNSGMPWAHPKFDEQVVRTQAGDGIDAAPARRIE